MRMCRFDSVVALILLMKGADSFCPSAYYGSNPRLKALEPQLNMAPPEGPAGSFFHKVPEDDSDDDGGNGEDVGGEGSSSDAPSMEEAINELIEKRKRSPRASQPSTISGVPTSQTGTRFGKSKNTESNKKNTKQSTSSSSKPYIPIGPPDTQPINNPSKPEFDDQGYTLYTDKETGQKARVFEALVEYPCNFTMKIVGANEGSFVSDMVGIVAEACEETPDKVPHSVRAMGKWTSVTVEAPVKSSEMLYALYEKLDLDPRVRFKF